MTEQEYTRLAAACDHLLRATGTTLARLAIPALHVVNEHPGSLAQYQRLNRGANLTDGPRAALRVARGLGRSLRDAPTALPARAAVIIVSHLCTAAQWEQHEDFYFGPLQNLLRERGVSSLLVLINHLPYPPSGPGPAGIEPRILLPRTVSPAEELHLWRQCVIASRMLRKQGPEQAVARFASGEALAAGTANNLRLHAQLSRLCKILSPQIVITTYEGDASERVIWHAARAAKRRPLCVGYQHARLLKHAHAIRRRVAAPGLDCDPDVVLTLGAGPHRILAGSPEMGATQLLEYGSHRMAPVPATDLPKPADRPRQCVVLPDADDQECAALFQFAVAAASQRPDIRFVLRPHPIVDPPSLVRRHPQLQSLPNNVTLAPQTSLSQELARSRYCLYRSSSAAVLAVQAGIKPFYLAHAGELPIDALFELTDWRETVTSPTELNRLMGVADDRQDKEAAAQAADLYRHYASPVNPNALDELLRISRSTATDSFGC